MDFFIYVKINPTFIYRASLRNCNKFVKDSDQNNKLHILCPKVLVYEKKNQKVYLNDKLFKYSK